METNLAVASLKAKVSNRHSTIIEKINGLLIFLACLFVFLPEVNPGRILTGFHGNTALITIATSYDAFAKIEHSTEGVFLASGHFHSLMTGAAVVILGIISAAISACMYLGNNKMKKRASLVSVVGALTMSGGLFAIYNSYLSFKRALNAMNGPEAMLPRLPVGFYLFLVLAALIFIFSALQFIRLLPTKQESKMEMNEKYKLFLMLLPILVIAFLFCYLPVYNWRFAFFDYSAGQQLSADNFIGFGWFYTLFANAGYSNQILEVLRNTLIMSALGIATSWLPVAFAILLSEIRSSKFSRFVHVCTSLPHFITWILVYSIAMSIFSTDGFVNHFLTDICGIPSAANYLHSPKGTWFHMLLWNMWKTLGWSSALYVAAISCIDRQLFDAARVDGASRWQCIRNITLPALLPTYCIILLISFAGILTNGMEQYLVFRNEANQDMIEVLDLYIYDTAITNDMIPMATVISISKSIISVLLLLVANRISKSIRGESII